MSQSSSGPAANAPAGSSLSKTNKPKAGESHWYQEWNRAGYFRPSEKGEP